MTNRPQTSVPTADRPVPARARRPSAPLFLSLDEVAHALGVSKKTISRRVKAKELHTHRVGRQLRVSEEDLASYLAARRSDRLRPAMSLYDHLKSDFTYYSWSKSIRVADRV